MAEEVSWKALFADTLLAKQADGSVVQVPVQEALANKHIGIYFSAHWCPPCRNFTPQLRGTYNRLKADGKDFAIVFVSMDRTQEQFDQYYGSMPWLAVPWRDEQLRSVLTRKFQVNGIPHLTILAPDSTILSSNARAVVATDPTGEQFPWKGAQEPKGLPIHWMMLAFLVYLVLNQFLWPLINKALGGSGSGGKQSKQEL